MEEFLRKCLPTAARVWGARYVGDSHAMAEAEGNSREGESALLQGSAGREHNIARALLLHSIMHEARPLHTCIHDTRAG